jgi:hypothetical protein
MIVIKTSTELDKIMSRKRYAKQLLNFNPICIRHIIGWLAFVKLNPYSILFLFIIISFKIKWIKNLRKTEN